VGWMVKWVIGFVVWFVLVFLSFQKLGKVHSKENILKYALCLLKSSGVGDSLE
jgi:hypothetical protein